MIRFNKEIQGTRDSDNYATPKKFYNTLNNEFNFNFDPCPYKHNLNEWDGLKIDWDKRCFINPPYSNIKPFIMKAIEEMSKLNGTELCVFLLPVRSDVKYWHDFIMMSDEIRFIKGRLNFNEAKTPAPFPCCLVIFNKKETNNNLTVISYNQ